MTATSVDEPRPAVVAVPPASAMLPDVTWKALRSGSVSENTVPPEPVVSRDGFATRLAACAAAGVRSKPPRARTQAAARVRVSNTPCVSKRTVRILPPGREHERGGPAESAPPACLTPSGVTLRRGGRVHEHGLVLVAGGVRAVAELQVEVIRQRRSGTGVGGATAGRNGVGARDNGGVRPGARRQSQARDRD